MCEIRQQWKQKVNDVLCFGHQSMFFVSFQDNTSRLTALQLPWGIFGKITNLVVKNLLSWVIKVFTVEQTHNHWLNYKCKKDLRRCYLWWHFFGWFIVFVHDYHILSHVGFVLILKPPFVSSPFALLFSDDNECEKFSSNNTSRFS